MPQPLASILRLKEIATEAHSEAQRLRNDITSADAELMQSYEMSLHFPALTTHHVPWEALSPILQAILELEGTAFKALEVAEDIEDTLDTYQQQLLLTYTQAKVKEANILWAPPELGDQDALFIYEEPNPSAYLIDEGIALNSLIS